MTIFRAHQSWTPGEDTADVHHDPIPATVTVLWDAYGDRWDRLEGLWVATGETDPLVLDDAGLLDEFGPVADEEKP